VGPRANLDRCGKCRPHRDFFLCKISFIGPSFEVQHSCLFIIVLRVETYFHVSRVQCVGGIGSGGGEGESGFRIGAFGTGGSVRIL
jgi:hypothetical protein